MLQQSLDAVLDNHGRTRITGPNRRALISLVDLFAGPKGKLGGTRHKRVDYSGVARAVPLASLADRTMLLPRSMALELFKPFIYSLLEIAGHVTTIKEARRLVESRDPRALEALQALCATHPLIVVNENAGEAPTVLGVDVELSETNAIALSVRAFDALGLAPGSSVVVHVPIGREAIAETRQLGFDPLRPRLERATGWLAQVEALKRPGPFLIQAALNHDVDPVRDRVAKVMLGRLVELETTW